MNHFVLSLLFVVFALISSAPHNRWASMQTSFMPAFLGSNRNGMKPSYGTEQIVGREARLYVLLKLIESVGTATSRRDSNTL